MNIVLLIVLIIIVCTAINGYKKGMIDELISLVALIAGIVLLAIVASVIGNYITKQTSNMVIGIVLFIAIVILMQIAQFISKGLRLIFHLPIINGVNKIAGLALGALEGIIMLWIVFIILQFFTFGTIGLKILEGVQESAFLTYLYQNNYISHLFSSLYQIDFLKHII